MFGFDFRTVILPCILGVCLGTFLVYFSTHNLTEAAALFLFGVLLNICILGFLTFCRKQNEGKNKEPIKLRYSNIDRLSAAAVAIWLACPWAIYFSPIPVKGNPTVHYSIWIWVFGISGLPAVFGTIWLMKKYTDLEISEGKRNFFFRWKLHLWLIAIFMIIPLFMMDGRN